MYTVLLAWLSFALNPCTCNLEYPHSLYVPTPFMSPLSLCLALSLSLSPELILSMCIVILFLYACICLSRTCLVYVVDKPTNTRKRGPVQLHDYTNEHWKNAQNAPMHVCELYCFTECVCVFQIFKGRSLLRSTVPFHIQRSCEDEGEEGSNGVLVFDP